MREKKDAGIHCARAEKPEFDVQPKPHREQEKNHISGEANADQSGFVRQRHAGSCANGYDTPSFSLWLFKNIIIVEIVKNILFTAEV